MILIVPELHRSNGAQRGVEFRWKLGTTSQYDSTSSSNRSRRGRLTCLIAESQAIPPVSHFQLFRPVLVINGITRNTVVQLCGVKHAASAEATYRYFSWKYASASSSVMPFG